MINQKAPLAHTILSIKKNSLKCGKSWSSNKHIKKSKFDITRFKKRTNSQLELQRTFLYKLPVLTEGLSIEKLSKLNLKQNVSKFVISQILNNKGDKNFHSKISNNLVTSIKTLSKKQKNREDLYSKLDIYYARKR